MKYLSLNEKNRYSRHISLSEIGEDGQLKIKNAKVLIVGVGGLGSPLALYLSAAGVGTLGLIDDDVVSETNLQRQILYNSNEIGKSKVELAAEKLKLLNPNTKFNSYNKKLELENAESIISDYDIIVDGCDNLPTRYLIDSLCVKLNKVYVYGSIVEFSGQMSVFNYKGGAVYTDLFPYTDDINTITQPKGVIGPLPGVIASLQTNEVLKIICDYGDVMSNKLLMFDGLKCSFSVVNI